ncbi:putative ABC transporter permease [Paraeggerthella sp.]|uniref:putative ABC transporter permease n=1 Tax=Paraeggerthella sp. TaxID=2897350 RepID=UPI003529AE22
MEKEPQNSSVFKEIGQEVREQVKPNFGYLKIDYFTLFWLFVAGSMFGLAVETIFHAIVYGGYESRAGLVWGPFSPIYGMGAVLLTVSLNRFHHSHNLIIFIVSMVLGSAIEYTASWLMEMLWGAIAWDYAGTFGSIGGRTNFAFGVMWGLLGLLWVRSAMPLVKRAFSHVNARTHDGKSADRHSKRAYGAEHCRHRARPRSRKPAGAGRARRHLGAARFRRVVPATLHAGALP